MGGMIKSDVYRLFITFYIFNANPFQTYKRKESCILTTMFSCINGKRNNFKMALLRRRSALVFSLFLFAVCLVFATHASEDDEDDDDESLTLKAAHDYCIVGGGPAGLQMAFHMAKARNDFILLERTRPGVKFETQPVHRELISINKRFTSRANPVFNERHDWNSLLSDDDDLLMAKKFRAQQLN